jgi:hypothetical protein
MEMIRSGALESHPLRVVSELLRAWETAWEVVDPQLRAKFGAEEITPAQVTLFTVARPECIVSDSQMIKQFVQGNEKCPLSTESDTVIAILSHFVHERAAWERMAAARQT